jgi:hypothetical protein
VEEAAPTGTDDVTIVLEADKTRLQHEQDVLAAQRQDFAQERQRLEREHQALVGQIGALNNPDAGTRAVLEAARKLLAEQQRILDDRASTLEAERARLQHETADLADKLVKQAHVARPASTGCSVEAREQDVAAREKGVAAREQQVAKREQDVAAREVDAARIVDDAAKALAAVQAGAAPAPTVATAGSPKGATGPATADEVTGLETHVHSTMDDRGLLADDLPQAQRKLLAEATNAEARHDYVAARAALAQLDASVRGTKVDKAFVTAKMKRVNLRLQKVQTQLDAAKQATVRDLLAEVNDAFNDGHFDRANHKINQIIATLAMQSSG